jgi:AcrR family transcriptional regulator
MSTKPTQFTPGRRPSQRPGQAGSKRDQNRNERTQGLCEAALGLFLRSGLEAVTIDEITRAAGMAKGSFYRYFDDKAQLVDALFAPLAASLRAALDAARISIARSTTSTELQRAYEQLARHVVVEAVRAPTLVRLYLQECRGPARGARAPIRTLADDIAKSAVDLTHAAQGHGLLRDFSPNVTALGVVGAVETLLFYHTEGVDFGDLELAGRALIQMIVEGLGVRR